MKPLCEPVSTCVKCGADNNRPSKSQREQGKLPNGFYFENEYYECWYCGYIWVNMKLMKDE